MNYTTWIKASIFAHHWFSGWTSSLKLYATPYWGMISDTIICVNSIDNIMVVLRERHPCKDFWLRY